MCKNIKIVILFILYIIFIILRQNLNISDILLLNTIPNYKLNYVT